MYGAGGGIHSGSPGAPSLVVEKSTFNNCTAADFINGVVRAGAIDGIHLLEMNVSYR